MARAITAVNHVETTEFEEQQRALENIGSILSSHTETLEDIFDLLSQLHRSGVLQLLRALFEHGSGVLEIIVSMANQPGYVGGIKNAIAVVQGFSSINSQVLGQGFRAMSKAAEVFADSDTELEPMGMLEVLQKLRDPDINTAMAAVFTILKGLGQGLRDEDKMEHGMEPSAEREATLVT